MRKRIFTFLTLTVLWLFTACSSSGSTAATVPMPTEQTKVEETTPTCPEPTRKVVGYTSDEEPIYEDQVYIPEPSYYDEYGVKYILQEGTIDDYYIDEDYQEVIETPESSAFTEISYWPFFLELSVQFRESGATYVYYDVEPETWLQFKNADSKGGFFNEFIKGQYEYDRE